MRRLLLLAALPAALQGAPAPAVRPLLERLETAEASYYHARAALAEAEAEARPAGERAEELKSLPQPGLWQRFLLGRRLAALQAALDRLRRRRLEAEAARQEYFLMLSAVQEEARSAVASELERPSKGGSQRLRELLLAKERWDAKMQELGFSEERPFPMQEDPGEGASRLSRQDRSRLLEARAVQLEAWASLAAEDLRLFRQPRTRRALGEEAARRKVARLEDLAARIALLAKENERLLSKN